MLELMPERDLIIDEYGNYYFYVKKREGQIVLANAFMDYSFRFILSFNEDWFKKEFKNYEHEYFGKHAMDLLKYKIKNIEEGNWPGHIYTLEQVINEFGKDNIGFIPLFEREPDISKR